MSAASSTFCLRKADTGGRARRARELAAGRAALGRGVRLHRDVSQRLDRRLSHGLRVGFGRVLRFRDPAARDGAAQRRAVGFVAQPSARAGGDRLGRRPQRLRRLTRPELLIMVWNARGRALWMDLRPRI